MRVEYTLSSTGYIHTLSSLLSLLCVLLVPFHVSFAVQPLRYGDICISTNPMSIYKRFDDCAFLIWRWLDSTCDCTASTPTRKRSFFTQCDYLAHRPNVIWTKFYIAHSWTDFRFLPHLPVWTAIMFLFAFSAQHKCFLVFESIRGHNEKLNTQRCICPRSAHTTCSI